MTRAQNSRSSAKGKPRGRPFAKGKSGNPGGRPRKQESITAQMREMLNLSPVALADQFEAYSQQLRQGGKANFAALIAVRQLMALASEPDARLLREVLDRTEGRVPTVVVTWQPLWVEALKVGEVSPEWVRKTLGDDELAQELFLAAGVTLANG